VGALEDDSSAQVTSTCGRWNHHRVDIWGGRWDRGSRKIIVLQQKNGFSGQNPKILT